MRARPVFLGLAALTCSACLIASVADFPAQQPTAPFLDGTRATPPVASLVTLEDDAPQTFATEVHSEDDGVPLELLLIADWKTDAELVLATAELAPASFDPARTVSLSFDPLAFTPSGPKLAVGCHTVTLIASHHFDRFAGTTPASADDSDVIVWYVALVDPKQPGAPASCPVAP